MTVCLASLVKHQTAVYIWSCGFVYKNWAQDLFPAGEAVDGATAIGLLTGMQLELLTVGTKTRTGHSVLILNSESLAAIKMAVL